MGKERQTRNMKNHNKGSQVKEGEQSKMSKVLESLPMEKFTYHRSNKLDLNIFWTNKMFTTPLKTEAFATNACDSR